MSAAAAAAAAAGSILSPSFLEHQYFGRVRAGSYGETKVRYYVARLKNDTEVEILSPEYYGTLTPFERSVEGSYSSKETGTFRTLEQLEFMDSELNMYFNALRRLDSFPAVLPPPPGTGDASAERIMDVFVVRYFHSRVTFAIQNFDCLPYRWAYGRWG